MEREAFARYALDHFRAVCAEASGAQRQFLERRLRENADTVVGRRFGFSGLRGAEDYRRRVPLSRFSDYEALVRAEIAGQAGMLTAEAPAYYSISAGSTGAQKYIPLVRADVRAQHLYEDGAVAGVLRERLGPPRGRIFETGAFYRTAMPDGTPNGVRSGAWYRLSQSGGSFDAAPYCAPFPVLFPERVEELRYVKLRFALADPALDAVHGVFAHKVVAMFRFLEEHLDAILRDLETGGVGEEFGLREPWRRYLTETLPPDPVRAAALRRALGDGEPGEGFLRKLWPRMRYVRCIAGQLFGPYLAPLERYARGLPLHTFAYACSESNLGIAPDLGVRDAYALLPDACYFEFLPEGASETLGLTEVERGGRYELILTTLSGLYRYRLGDEVEVTDFLGETPVVRICRRIGQALNLADENMNAGQLRSALSAFLADCGAEAACCCAAGCYDGGSPRYRVYLETASRLPADAAERLDRLLGENCFGYRGARALRELGAAELRLLPPGTLEAWESGRAAAGARTEQAKPPLVASDAQRDFFEAASQAVPRGSGAAGEAARTERRK